MSQREKMLLLLGVILIVCTLALWEWPESPQPSSSPLRVGQSTHDALFLPSALTRNLESRRTMILKNPRNIFAPLKNPHKPKTVKATSPAVKDVPLPGLRQAPHRPTGPSPAELAARQAREEMRQYKFLGYLTKEGIQQGFLSKDERIFIVQAGETLEKGITIRSIDPTEVVLSRHVKQTDTTIEATLPLTNDERDAS